MKDLARPDTIHSVTDKRPMRLHGNAHPHNGEGIQPCCLVPAEKVERVVWTDSGMFIDEGWAKTHVYQSAARKWSGDVVTIGQPIYEDDTVLVLGLSHDRQTDNWFGAQLIAKACIKERHTI
jgi:hypothetical protein